MNILPRITGAVRTKTLNHFLITASGTAVNGILGLLFYVITAKSLGPVNFGLLMIAITTLSFVADLADLGIDSGMVRFVGKYHPSNQSQALSFVKTGLAVKLLVWIMVLVLGWILAPLISEQLFLKKELTFPLRLAFLGVGGAMGFSLISHTLQALQKFWAWSCLNIAMNGLRLVIVLGLITSGVFGLYESLITYICIPFLGFFVGLLILPKFFNFSVERKVVKELFAYSKWVAILSILTATSSRLDTFISGRLLTSAEVGIYSAANQMVSVVPQLIFALATVVAPKLGSFNNDQKAIAYLKKLQILVIGIALLILPAIPLSFWLVPLVFGVSYQSSIAPFIILLIAQLVFLLALPAHQTIFYYFAKPRFFVYVALGQLLISSVLGWLLISSFGIIGSALTILAANLFSFIISLIWVIWKFRTKR